jgi:hypothetical protein
MGVFDEEVATALELIKEFGQQVTWRQPVSTADAAEPWKAGTQTTTEHKPYICFVPVNNAQWRKFMALLKGTEVPVGRLAGLMGAQKFKPTLKDVVIRNGATLRINDIDELNPNGQVVLYTLEFIE